MAKKRIKNDYEVSLIKNMWSARKRYIAAKAEYDSTWGNWMDGELVRKAKARMDKCRRELKAERRREFYRMVA